MDARLSKAIFAPRSIAIVGASADPAKVSSRPLRYLVDGGYRGAIYPVNPRIGDIGGIRCWPHVTALPETPDLVFILLSSDAAVDAVEQCGKAGVAVAMVLASGFGESGHTGKAREARLAKVAAETGIRLIGPSCLGLANLHQGLVVTANAAFAEGGQVAGGVFCASQSGSMIGALLSRGRAKGISFAGLISVGGELDLSLGSLCEGTLDDSNITSYMLFLETMRDAAAIRRFAIGAAERGKPIVALKLGRSKAAADLATTHTGGLAGEDAVVGAFLADCGIARVDSLEALLEAGPLLRRVPSRRASGGTSHTVGVVTTTGGGAALVVDQLGTRGINVEAPDATVMEKIRAKGVDVGGGRILDLTMAGVRYEVMRAALEAMLNSTAYEMVIAVVGSSARFQPDLAVQPIIDISKQDGRLAVFIVPEAPEALAMLTSAGIPCFRTPESCADAVSAALKRRPPRALALPAEVCSRDTHVLDEMEGYALLRELGVQHAPATDVGPRDPSPATDFYPAAVKILGRNIAHKTEIGGVALGIRSAEAFEAAAGRIRTRVAVTMPELDTTRMLVQKMVEGAVAELLIGYRVDPQAGPIVVIASGGIATEVTGDRALRMAPVDLKDAQEMISELKTFPLLTGFRGRPEGDIEAVARAIVGISRIALRPEVRELEINPLMVMPKGQGAVAVDVVARVAGNDRD